MSKFKVGDKVKLNKLVGNFKYGRGIVNFKSIGKIIGITEDNEYYVCFPENKYWLGREIELVLVEDYTYEDLKKSPVGTKITFENGNMFLKYSEEKFINLSTIRETKYLNYLRDNYGQLGKIIKIEEPEYRTVYKDEGEILDKQEKRYLKAIIKPFRNRLENIQKNNIIIKNT